MRISSVNKKNEIVSSVKNSGSAFLVVSQTLKSS